MARLSHRAVQLPYPDHQHVSPDPVRIAIKYACGILYGLLLATQTGVAVAVEQNAAPETVRALLYPVTESLLSSQMSGRIVQVGVKDGEHFKQGQSLIEFDCGVQNAQLAKAMAVLKAANTSHHANLRLKEFNSIGQLELELSAAEINKASADVSVVKAEVDHCKVTAPYAGRVAKVHVHAYDSVAVNQPLIEILDAGVLEIRMYAPAAWLSWVKPGTSFQVTIDETGKSYSAKVVRLGARVDPASHSFDVIGILDAGRDDLLAGMSGAAVFARSAQE